MPHKCDHTIQYHFTWEPMYYVSSKSVWNNDHWVTSLLFYWLYFAYFSCLILNYFFLFFSFRNIVGLCIGFSKMIVVDMAFCLQVKYLGLRIRILWNRIKLVIIIFIFVLYLFYYVLFYMPNIHLQVKLYSNMYVFWKTVNSQCRHWWESNLNL